MRWKKNNRKKVPLRILLPILILFIFFCAFLIIRSNILIIRLVDVDSKKVGCASNEQIRDSSQILGQIFLLINSSKIESDLKKKFFCIGQVTTSGFLNKVKLSVFGREPAAILIPIKNNEATNSSELREFSEASPSATFTFLKENSPKEYVVDKEGVIYSTESEMLNVPKLYITGLDLNLGQRVKEELISNTLKILKILAIFGVNVNDAKIYSDNLLLINALPRIIFRLDANVNWQIASLQLILKTAKISRRTVPTEVGIDESSLEFIDLRFDKPVVRIAPKKK